MNQKITHPYSTEQHAYATLNAHHDPMGQAILDYQESSKVGRLTVHSSMFEDDEMPVKHLFRNSDQMPALERKALSLARGRVLDVGAGAGCHTLTLQERGLAVKAIDISPLSCEAMRLRGVRDVECTNVFDPRLRPGFDTILLLMNGTGIAGTLAQLPILLARLRSLLAPGGQIITDSTDLRYIYEDEEGHLDIDPSAPYYGEVDYRMTYRATQGSTVIGASFNWLYVDFDRLQQAATACSLHCTLEAQGDHYDYLARMW